MQFIRQVRAILWKEVLIELRNRYVISGLLLYVASSVAVIYFSLQYSASLRSLDASVWGIFFWLVVLFSTVNAVANSFFREPEGRFYYYYWTISPQALISAKLIYNFLFTILLSTITLVMFSVMLGEQILNYSLFFITLTLGATGYSFLFTTMSAIASRAGNNATLMAILGFPLVIPLIIFLTRLTAACLDSANTDDAALQNVLLLLAFNVLQPVMAVVLFPYIWRD